MDYLTGDRKQEAEHYLSEAEKTARKATCERSKCGAVIVGNGQIIGTGHNSPPKDNESQRRCGDDKTRYHRKVTDKTCCVHAEQRAVLDALKRHPEEIDGSMIYFVRLDGTGEHTPSGNPYCTICSKLCLDAGLRIFVFKHKDGIAAYDTEEYNIASFMYAEKPDRPKDSRASPSTR